MNKDSKDKLLSFSYEFWNIEDFYYYIYESWLCGNKEQSKELFKQLSNKEVFFNSIRIYDDYQYVQFLEFLLKN